MADDRLDSWSESADLSSELPDVWDGKIGMLPEDLNPSDPEGDWQTSPQRVDELEVGPAVVYGGRDGSSRDRPSRDRPSGSGQRPQETAGRGREKEESTGSKVLASIVGHVLVPGAVIAMVSALLFFLYDVRSVFLPGAGQLKWLGFWFVWGTVLIARYGRFAGAGFGALPATAYSAGLGFATFAVMLASPWEAPEAGIWGPLSNGVILIVVWRFASSLTVALSEDLERSSDDEGPRLFGLERLEMERLAREREARGQGPSSVYELGRRRRLQERRKNNKTADPDKASRSVVRLVIVGLAIFAFCEPVLLAGHGSAAGRALGAMVVFLLASALLSAAANCWGYLRRVRELGGEVEVGVVAQRLGAAFGLMAVLLLLALGTPGLQLQGRGELVPVGPDGPSIELESGDRAGDRGSESEPPGAEAEAAGDSQAESPADGDSATSAEGSGSSAGAMGQMLSLVHLLRWPFRALLVLAALWALWQSLPALRLWLRERGGGSWIGRLAAWWAGLFAGFGGRAGRNPDGSKSEPLGDPFAALGELGRVESQAGVLESYARLRLFWRRVGYEPDPSRTPSEVVSSMPVGLRSLREPCARLVAVYSRCAYGDVGAEPEDLRVCVAALEELRQRVESHDWALSTLGGESRAPTR